jgi:hypothetical protein
MALWLIEDTGWLFPYAPDRAHCIRARLQRAAHDPADEDYLAAASISPGENAAELPNQLLRLFLGCVLMLCIRARLNSLRKNSLLGRPGL